MSVQFQLAAREKRLDARIDKSSLEDCEQPTLRPGSIYIYYELANRTVGLAYGGIGAMRLLLQETRPWRSYRPHLQLLKIRLPYHNDHVLNLAYNALCDGDRLEGFELRRTDEVYLNALGARRTDPTTAGDFCRCFELLHIRALLDVHHETRFKVGARQPREFFNEARIDIQGTLVPTGGEYQDGIGTSHQGIWGDHPLVESLANTGEALSVVKSSGKRH